MAACNSRVIQTNVIGVDLSRQNKMQVGINSDEASQIAFSFERFNLDMLKYIEGSGVGNKYSIEILDSLITTLNSKSTEYGGVENRLTSVLEEISIQYENLVSSRSTLRDADMSEVSSDYIKQQILQQASSTLMSTANQIPAIAIQLL